MPPEGVHPLRLDGSSASESPFPPQCLLPRIAENWTWVPFSNAFCANGDAAGIGVNLTGKSKRVVVYLEGGGACWDEDTCYTLGHPTV
ncbi:hypothetical protein [Sorangium sp. So ce363]|uniref:hypothetical protein n=1 Tax=Sorangium sp. So ce363 TaxID=3133304 RepID=UPI003F60ABEA